MLSDCTNQRDPQLGRLAQEELNQLRTQQAKPSLAKMRSGGYPRTGSHSPLKWD